MIKNMQRISDIIRKDALSIRGEKKRKHSRNNEIFSFSLKKNNCSIFFE